MKLHAICAGMLFLVRIGQAAPPALPSDSATPHPDTLSRPGWRVSGYVVDAETRSRLIPDRLLFDGNPVPLDSNLSFQFVTSARGSHVLAVHKYGYRSGFCRMDLDTSDGTPVFVVPLQDTTRSYVLRKAVVKARKEPLHRTAKIPTVSLKKTKIRATPAIMSDPLRALTSLPGVTTESDASSRPIVRGGDPLESRIDLHGISLLQPYHFGGAKSILNPVLVDEIVLHKSGLPPRFHNAQSAVVEVKQHQPLGGPFRLNFDWNMLQYNAYVESPLWKDRAGIGLATQGSYQNWAFQRTVALLDNEEDEGWYQALRATQLPDYRDYAAVAGIRLGNQSRLSLAEMYHTDRFSFVAKEPADLFRFHFTDLDTIVRVLRPEYIYDPVPHPVLEDPRTGRDRYPDSTEYIPDGGVIRDTSFLYHSVYNIVSGFWDCFWSDRSRLQTSLAWQHRTWDILFIDDYNLWSIRDTTRQRYDVTLDQWNLHQAWIYSGIHNHDIYAGLQFDYARQSYEVDLPRLLHEIITTGSTNIGDHWGPFSGDSGIGPVDLKMIGGGYQPKVTPTIRVRYSGSDRYGSGAVYLSDRWQPTPRLRLNLGGRLEGNERDRSVTFSPRATAFFQLAPTHEWMVTAGRYTQNNYEVQHIALSQQLRPEKVWHAGLGWEWQPILRFNQGVNVYTKRYSDLISEQINPIPMASDSVDDLLVRRLTSTAWRFYEYAGELSKDQYQDSLFDAMTRQVGLLRTYDPIGYEAISKLLVGNRRLFSSHFTNAGSGTAFGLEYFLQYEPANWWHGRFSLALAGSSRRRGPRTRSHPFPLDRPLVVSLVNVYKFARGYELALKWTRMSGLPYTRTVFDEESVEIGPYNDERYDHYSRLDLRLTKRFSMLGHEVRWYTEVWNALNTPNAFLSNPGTREILSQTPNMPIPFLFTGIEFNW